MAAKTRFCRESAQKKINNHFNKIPIPCDIIMIMVFTPDQYVVKETRMKRIWNFGAEITSALNSHSANLFRI
jgi:hypothetical protein